MSRFFAAALLSSAMAFVPPAFATLEERIPIALESGRKLEAVLRRPTHVTAPLPAVVLIGGFERGVGALDLLPARENLIFVGLNYPVDVPRRIRWWQIFSLANQLERGVADMREALGLLHRELRQRKDIDARRIAIAGVSFGAPFAVMAAAENGYPQLVVAHGFGDVPGVIRYQFEKRWEPKYGAAGRAAAWLAERGIALLVDIPQPEPFAERLRAEQDVLVVSAANDDFIPASASAALVEALRRSEAEIEVQITAGKHVRGHNAEAIRALYHVVEEWLQR